TGVSSDGKETQMRARNLCAAARNLSARPIELQRLEDRRLMAVTLGTNAIVNPGAEANTGGTGSQVILPTGWTATGKPTIIKYGTSGFPLATSPGPATRGKNFFAGGPSLAGSATSDLFQTI